MKNPKPPRKMNAQTSNSSTGKERKYDDRSFILFGKEFQMRFQNVVRHTRERSTGANEWKEQHDNFCWEGQLTIKSSRYSEVVLKFTTDLFWPESVKGFDFPKVILLFVDRAGKELYTPRLEPGKIATLIDYFALRSFAQATLHGKEDIHIEPFKLVRGRDSFLEHTDLFD